MASIEVTMISIDLARGNLRIVVVHVRVYSVPTAFLLEFAMPSARRALSFYTELLYAYFL